jgi:hypothetical protein
MTIEPRIPMRPEDRPQQRIHEIVVLPARPDPFDCSVGYGQFPKGALPSSTPKNKIWLCQVEWAWTPMHNRLDAYYLHRGRTHWSLWSQYWDDNYDQWSVQPMGCVPRRGTPQKEAAVYLLLEHWREELSEYDLDEFHWINEARYLSIAELAAIAREVWGEG